MSEKIISIKEYDPDKFNLELKNLDVTLERIKIYLTENVCKNIHLIFEYFISKRITKIEFYKKNDLDLLSARFLKKYFIR